MRKPLFSASLAALAASLSVPAAAQQAVSQGETVLSPIIVTTPLRRESQLAAATASVTVIDRAEIERSAATSLTSLLKSRSGISITGYGGLGATTDLELRGLSGKQTLVLVNGVRVAAATTGSTPLANIPLESIERVEIVRGPHSAAYGADALGGVINIITKQGSSCLNGKAVCGSISAGVSHPWGAFTAADIQGEKDGLTFALGASLAGTRGYNFTLPGNSSFEPDDDGFRRGSFNFAIAKAFDWGRVYTDGLVSKGRNQYDDPWGSNESDMVTFAGKVGLRLDHSEDWLSTLEVSQGFDEADNFRKAAGPDGLYITRRTGAFARTQKSFEAFDAEHMVSLGGEIYRETVDSLSSWGSYAGGRNLASVFGQYSLERGPLHFDGGLRQDHNGQFGDAFTYNTGLAYDVTPDVTLRASHGTGFRAPTFSDLYYPGWSNPNLKPEKSRSYEIGAVWQAGVDTRLEASLYRTDLRSAIGYIVYIPYNIDRARVTGLELSARHAFNERFALNGGLDLRDPRDRTLDKYIPYRERFKANLGFDFEVTEALSLSASALYGSGAYSDAANTQRLGSYVTFDVSGTYALDAQSSLKLSAENLLDKEYSSRDGYRAPGRTVTLSFTRKF